MNKFKWVPFSASTLLIALFVFSLLFYIHSNQVIAQKKLEQEKQEEIAKQKIEKQKEELQKLQEQKKEKILKENEEFAKQKVVFITIDDGPTIYTSRILDILKENNVHATFFDIGNQIKGNEGIIKRTINEGNVIGLHSMTHRPDILFNNPVSYINEFKEEQKLFASMGIITNITRSPYGSVPYVKQSFRDLIAAAHMKLWDWNIDSEDWRYRDQTEMVIETVKREIKNQHEVVLMHDQEYTLKNLPVIIKIFKDRGYTFEIYKPELNFTMNFWNDKRL